MSDQYAVSTSTTNMVTYPLWLQPQSGDPTISFNAIDFRHLLDAAVPGIGVIDPYSWTVSQRGAGANFSVDIAAGGGIVLGSTVASQGKYLCRSTGVVNLTTPTAPASGTRTHLVVAEILDKLSGSGSTYGWQFHLIEDTGSGLPATPANTVPICSVSIAAGQASVQNANITDKRLSAQHNASCQLYRTTGTQTLPNGSRAAIQFDTESEDLFGWANVATDVSTINPREPGMYDLEVSAFFSATSAECEVGIYLNGNLAGGAIGATITKMTGSSGGKLVRGTTNGYHLTAGVAVRGYAYCTTSGVTISQCNLKVHRREWRAS